ncbi:MAG: anaerobic ribonucleoside-triphosphate reductase activating protein [Treponema sp.]|nr:anaerobic ribonucleoside-triphosphate reductase activating protein [Treponema sp.]
MGLQKTSLIDYPGIVAAVVFLPLCNFRCPWCQNSPLVNRAESETADLIPLDTVNTLLLKRRSVLEGVVISGGEPTLTKELPDLISLYKNMGFKVKLDTNGSRSDILEKLLSHKTYRPDYIAIDLKLPPNRYAEVGGDGNELLKSIDIIKQSSVAHELRTIVLPGTNGTTSDIQEMALLVDDTTPWYFSPFRPGSCLDPSWNLLPPTSESEVARAADYARSLGKRAYIRGINHHPTESYGI